MSNESFATLQLGMGWFPEQAGGLTRFYSDLLRHLPPTGVEVRGLVAGSPEVMRESVGRVRAFAPISAPLLSRCWAARPAVAHEIAKGQVALVASHFALYTRPVLDLIRPYPLVIHFHGPWALEGHVEGGGWLETRIKHYLERTVYRQGTRFIVLSHAFGRILHQNYGVPLERVRVVPGGVEADRWHTGLVREQARERLGWPLDRPVLLVVRRLLRRMGLEDLIRATKDVRRRVPEVLLLIAGTGALYGELVARVRSEGLESNVRLLGFLPDQDLPLAYCAADLTIVPSVAFEGFGLAVVESLASGTPALVTPVGGLPEVVRDLSPGLVLPATGVNPMSERLVAALSGELTLPSPHACQAYAREYFDWSRIAPRVRQVYSEVLR